VLRKHPQRIAWLTVYTGLLVLCLSCSAAGYGVYYFLFQSPVPLSVRMVVARGAVKLTTLDSTNPLVDRQINIDPQTYIDVRDDSQAVLYFQDSYSRETVTTMTLTGGTKLFVAEATRPRFDFSRRPYRIDLSRADGQMIVTTTPEGRDLLLDIRSDLGIARLLDDGRYTINTELYPETKLRRLNLFNQGGVARLYKTSLSEWREVNPNRIAHLVLHDGGVPDFEPESDSPYIILAEGRFISDTAPPDKTALPDGWQHVSTVERDTNEPNGEFIRDADAGYVLRLWRLGEKRVKHAQTDIFWKAGRGIDLTPYGTLRLHLRLKLQSHNLPLCGIEGSECPLMIEIGYSTRKRNADGTTRLEDRRWNHGFYLIADPLKPPSCGTCRQAHERINENVWYFYDSGDLWTQFIEPDSIGAPIIREMTIYASGHQWDVMVSDITLLGTLRD
jgi:hypothetical protein